MVVDLTLCQVGLVIGNAIFIGKVVDDRRISTQRSIANQVGFGRRQQSAQPIVPRSISNPINRIDLVSIFIGFGT